MTERRLRPLRDSSRAHPRNATSIDKEIASAPRRRYIACPMRYHWLQPSLGALAILLPLTVAGQPPDLPEYRKAPPRKVVFSQRGEAMVDVAKVCPGICVEMRYATDRNAAKKVIYP